MQYAFPPQPLISNIRIKASFNSIQYTHTPQKLPTPHKLQTPAVNGNDYHPWFFRKVMENAPDIWFHFRHNWKLIFTTIQADLNSDKMQININSKHLPCKSSVKLKLCALQSTVKVLGLYRLTNFQFYHFDFGLKQNHTVISTMFTNFHVASKW